MHGSPVRAEQEKKANMRKGLVFLFLFSSAARGGDAPVCCDPREGFGYRANGQVRICTVAVWKVKGSARSESG